MNSDRQQTLVEIQKLISQYYAASEIPVFRPGESVVPLIEPSYGAEEVNQAVESLLLCQITLNQSAGNKIQQFENIWSQYIGVENGIMVNSGSSANLIALFALANPSRENPIKPGDEIITPAVTWHTTVSPIIAIGAVPVLVDVSLDDCTIDTDAIKSQITEKTKAIMPVHLMGNPCQMDVILEIAQENDLYVIEDVCEAHGASFNGRRCGGIGHVGTFSFFFSHHLTTMEGGMVVTADEELAELIRIMRSQGVIRNTRKSEELAEYYRNQPEFESIDERYLFANLGFNLRPTELNGGFGIEQFKKFPYFLERREDNGRFWLDRLSGYEEFFHFPAGAEGERSWFCFPLIIRSNAPFDRNQVTNFLNERKIETRPIMAGNVTAQPAMQLFEHRRGELPNAELIHSNGFFWGNHQGISEIQREYVASCIDEFIAQST